MHYWFRLFVHVCMIYFTSAVNIKVGVLLMTNATEPFDLRRVGPALNIAFELADTYYGIQFEPVYHNYTGFCPKEKVIGHLSELYYHNNVKAVIGPACSATLVAAGRLAQYLKLPMVSGVGDLIIRNKADKDMYTTFTRMSYNLGKLSNTVKAIMMQYYWKHVAIIYDQSYVFFDLAGSNLAIDFKADSSLPRPLDIPFVADKLKDPGTLLAEAQLHARFIIIFCHADLLRDFLYRAEELGMADGEYAFMTMELFPSDWLGHYMRFLRNDTKDMAVTKAYESLLLLTLKQPDNLEFRVFAEEVKRRAKADYGYTFGATEAVNYFITAFYDGALYLAEAYNRTIADNGDINDGLSVSQKVWNNTYPGITGPVAIDQLGDRIADFDVFDMYDSSSRAFQLVGRFQGATNMYKPVPNVEISWPNGLPVNMPRCGFRGELCVKETSNTVTIALSSTVISITVIGCIVAFVIYRKMKADADIGKKTWLIPWSDVNLSKGDTGSFMSKSRLSIMDAASKGTDGESAGGVQLFTQTGICRGNIVAIRKLNLPSIDLNHTVLLQFRQLQTCQHSNLARFIGACMEPHNNAILMEYCPRGSLQDIIENEDIDLDWTFRFSLLWDVVKGMEYLSGSALKYHGRLSSTNCVIDSRFMLKLTDFGIPAVFAMDELYLKGNVNNNKYLWTAPEILRITKNRQEIRPHVRQMADIYSFGIILQEIIVRGAPFEGYNFTASEILNRLSAAPGLAGPFRPIISNVQCAPELLHLMKDCWAEDPDERPQSFNVIASSLRKINTGNKRNIMDNLMARMEQYASNLESLVTERTRAYLDEKRRVEELLHRLLPQSVAQQLSLGQSVVPETFQSVTIYFSDIVGFTTIAGKSTPMEVVDLLNDIYTMFDKIIDSYDVYKVETIGDAYMVVSGLPERNGDNHVKNIADVALGIRQSVTDYKIRHLPGEDLRIRIGIHSGPVVAGVVGLTMPRYCLFGDTVNTASRMESTSEAMRIQMSSSAKTILDLFENYETEERGDIEVKGKGLMTTYWLHGKSTTTPLKRKRRITKYSHSENKSPSSALPPPDEHNLLLDVTLSDV